MAERYRFPKKYSKADTNAEMPFEVYLVPRVKIIHTCIACNPAGAANFQKRNVNIVSSSRDKLLIHDSFAVHQ